MSNDGQKFQQRILYHGENYGRSPVELGSTVLWTSTNKYIPSTYGTPYQLTIPKSTPDVTFDAKGKYWASLSDISNNKYRRTDDIVKDLLKDNNTATIKMLLM